MLLQYAITFQRHAHSNIYFNERTLFITKIFTGYSKYTGFILIKSHINIWSYIQGDSDLRVSLHNKL